jgi:Na+/H+ antiporter NhaA
MMSVRTAAGVGPRRRSSLHRFVATENSGAILLVLATMIALVWANSPWAAGYDALWATELGVSLGDLQLTHSLRDWVNEGLMAVFFFVAGLEIRREFDMGELRERRRVALPLLAAVGGMVVPALLYLAINATTGSAAGWGIVVGTDTAFALGVLSLSRGVAPRVRTFLLTMVVIDDVIALTVIAVAYTANLALPWLIAAAAVFGAILLLRRLRVRHLGVYAVAAAGLWMAVSASGVHPTIAGVAVGLVATAYPPGRERLRNPGAAWRHFRMTPTPRLAHRASRTITQTISPNELLQQRFHPWSSYLVVPLFALANAGLPLDSAVLQRAATSPITLGVVLGLVVGKPAGIIGATCIASRRRLGGLPLMVTWPSLAGAGALAGIGFTVSLLIADISFIGGDLDEAKIGILGGSLISAGLGWLVFRAAAALPPRLKAAGAQHLAPPITDLATPVEPDIDHMLGPASAPAIIVWYGGFECPHCTRTATIIGDLRTQFDDDLAVVFRHLPLPDIHPHAVMAAEAAEAAASQGKFWHMLAALFAHHHELNSARIEELAIETGLDLDRFREHLSVRRHALRVERDIVSAEDSGAAGTPTLFINGRRYAGPNEAAALAQAVGDALSDGRRSTAPPGADRRVRQVPEAQDDPTAIAGPPPA